jgi:hypothetical protein
MLALLRTFSWQELRHHPWRNAAAVVAVMLGVALAFSVHLINASALGEFSSAVRAVNGQPDLELRSIQGTLDESLFGRVATHPQVALASPVLELSTYATGPDRKRLPVRVVGVDALTGGRLAPALMPLPAPGADRLALLAPATVFLNPAAMATLVPGGVAGAGSAPSLQLQSALALRAVMRGRHGERARCGAGRDGHRRRAGPVPARQAASAASTCACSPAPTAMRPSSLALQSACGGDGWRARRRGRAGQQPVARLPREPHGAGAGGAVHRRVSWCSRCSR